MPQCIVKNCKNRTRSRLVLGQIKEKNINNVSYHRFPKNEKAKLLWLNILELNAELVPIGARICSAHFAEDAFNFLYGTKRLRPNALPYIERVIENVPNDGIIASSSVCNTLKIDRATSPIPGCSHFADQSTNTSPKRDHNALEKEYLHKKLQDTKTSFSKKFKLLQQKVRRKESRIISLEAILNSLKKNNMLGTEELQILQDIGGSNSKILERQLLKNRGKPVNKQFDSRLRSFALTLHYYSPMSMRHVFNKLILFKGQ